jgi:hypothetical protein
MVLGFQLTGRESKGVEPCLANCAAQPTWRSLYAVYFVACLWRSSNHYFPGIRYFGTIISQRLVAAKRPRDVNK